MTPEFFLSLVAALTVSALLVVAVVVLVRAGLSRRARPLPGAPVLRRRSDPIAASGRKVYTRIARYADGHTLTERRYAENLPELTDAFLQSRHPTARLVEVKEVTGVE